MHKILLYRRNSLLPSLPDPPSPGGDAALTVFGNDSPYFRPN